ncbi:hypothetical protein K488DRAFT_89434 [Vararia minispora EC-137]|uniref:Uncharacterized protein n=1 Tax=Vararia minispora EC-137 TaxID=1314806 RepID=A0ACB8QAI6_9AGAM|nr:hypothetical protein K488DRAFT_89434 [Vararia minispora EC-137]
MDDRLVQLREPTRRTRSTSRSRRKIGSIRAEGRVIQGTQAAVPPRCYTKATSSPIIRLPTELLTEIFLYVRQECESGDEASDYEILPSWTIVTQVCSRWRLVALSFKLLWTKLPVGGSRWTRVALASSNPLPLDIHFVLTGSAPAVLQVEGILKALEGTSRARDISLGDAWETEHESLLAAAFSVMSRHRASLLETFDIFDNHSDGLTNLPDGIFRGDVPTNLHTLVLHSIGFGSSQPLLRSPLTTLHLHSCRTNMSIQKMFSILATIPTLEDLSLEDTDFTDPNGDPLEERTCTELSFRPHSIALPDLRRLSFIDTVYMITTFMLYLILPSSAILELDCDCNSTTMGEAAAAMSVALQEHFSPAISAGLSFSDLVISCNNNPAENITFDLSVPFVRHGNGNMDPVPFPTRFSLSWALRQGETANSLAFLAELLPGVRHINCVRSTHEVLADAGTRCELARRVGFSSAAWL